MTDGTKGRLAFGFTMAGLLAAVACFVAMWQLPMYSSGETLAEVNGGGVLVLAALPVLVALVAWAGLHARCSRGSRAGGGVAGVAVGTLGMLSLLGAATIGVFLLPVAALLSVAVVTTPRGL